MIGLLEGIIYSKTEPNLIIMVNGVGYKVEATKQLLIKQTDEKVIVYIYTHVREDAIKLFGFISEQELNMFELLLSVSGVGPKGAMAIISTIGIQGVCSAVLLEDPKAFKVVSGIGTKNAERIIIDLKTKIKKDAQYMQNTDILTESSTLFELESALLSLGYSSVEVKGILPKLDQSNELQQLVKDSLRLLHT